MSDPEAKKRRLMEQMTDRVVNDPEFRERMRQDPEGTAEVFAQSSGVQLTEEHRQALRSIDWSLHGEQLAARINKMPAWS
jgi:hypothetical protein